MRQSDPIRAKIGLACLILFGVPLNALHAQQGEADKPAVVDSKSPGPDYSGPDYYNERIRGRVVWLSDALKERFAISTVPEARDRVLAIETVDGKLIPLVENLRGRAFRKDERLRNRPMEIWVRRYEDQPLAQVLRIFELNDDKLLEVDYWCDVCAIVMFETGPCSCCQDDNRLRKRPVDLKSLKFTRD